MYEVKQEDLIGDIEDFPIEVVQKMIEYQVKQGNKADVTVFQKDITSTHGEGGVSWGATQETFDFFQDIVKPKNFNLFFKRYPKENKELDNNIRREFLNQEYDTKEINTEWDGLTIQKMEIKESLKYDNEKLRWDLLPLEDIEDVVKVYTEGVKKYAPNSWQNLPDGYNRYKAAMFRHLIEYEKGNTIDEETGCLHLSQVVWNAIAMLHVSKNK
jgi:hypothetical protein